MTDKEMEQLAEVAGKNQAEASLAFMVLIIALRKQPGFDDGAFCEEVESILKRTDLSVTIRTILDAVIQKPTGE